MSHWEGFTRVFFCRCARFSRQWCVGRLLLNTQYGESHAATSWRHNLLARCTLTDSKLLTFSSLFKEASGSLDGRFGCQRWSDVRWEVGRLWPRHSSSFWFCPLFCPLLHLPIYFALKFCPCPCPLFCPENEGKPEGKGKGKIWGQNIWGNEEEGKIKEGKNTKFIWKNKWWPKNLVQQSQFPTFNEMLWNILRGQLWIFKRLSSLWTEHNSHFHFSDLWFLWK